jgi:hypothetical protein
VSAPYRGSRPIGNLLSEERDAHINFVNGEVLLNDVARESRAHGDANRECRVLTIFTSGKEGHNPQPTQRAEERRDKRVLNSPRNEEPISVKRGL